MTQGDLQKAPVRMLLFSLVTLLEMHMLRLVRLYYPDEVWKAKLKVDRLSDAKNIFGQRTGRNEAIDLADCLQFCDKRDLLLEHNTARKDMRLSRKGGEKLLKHAEKLRNNLAHGQDLVSDKDWEEIIELAEQIEKLVVTCESITETTSQATPLPQTTTSIYPDRPC